MSGGIVGTGNPYAGFFPKRIVGADVLETDIFGAAASAVKNLGGRFIGEAVVDPTSVGLLIIASTDTLGNRRLTIEGDLAVMADNGDVYSHAGSDLTVEQLVEGSRTVDLNSPDWYTDLPYGNTSGTTYRVYLHMCSIPIDVSVARDGRNIGYSKWIDVPGVVVNPQVVTDAGDHLEFEITTGLTSLGVQYWDTTNTLNDNWSYDVCVWLDTEQSGVTVGSVDPDVSIVRGKLVKKASGSGWLVSLDGLGDGYLGQNQASATLTHYRIAVLGPVITTTNYDNNPDYVHIGTVLSGVTETIVTGSQRVVASISQVVIQVSDVPDKLLTKGWYSTTTPTNPTASTIAIPQGAEWFVFGKLDAAGAGALGPFTAGTTRYVYYDANPSVLAWGHSTSWDTANDTGRIPYLMVITDGSANITTMTLLAYRVKHFNKQMTLTVGGSGEGHFSSIDKALAHVYGLRQSVSAPAPGVIIEVVDDITQSTISLAAWLNLPHITIRGRSGGGIYDGGDYAQKGSRIRWTSGALFSLGSGVTLNDWRFEDITFSSTANLSGAESNCVIHNSAGAVNGLVFSNCAFDGSTVGSNGYVPHVIYSQANQLKNVVFEHCQVNVAEAAVYVTSAAEGSENLVMRDCSFTNTGASLVFSHGGAVVDLAGTVSAAGWIIEDCTFSVKGPMVRAWDLVDSSIENCRGTITGDFSAVHLGSSTLTDGGAARVKIDKCYARVNGTGSAPAAILIEASHGTTDRASLTITNNILKGVSGNEPTGIRIDASNGSNPELSTIRVSGNTVEDFATTGIYLDGAVGAIISENIIVGADTSISANNTARVILSANVMEADTVCMYGDFAIAAHNMCKVTGTSGNGVFAENAVIPGVISGNVLDSGSTSSASTALYTSSEGLVVNNVIVGNNSNTTGIEAGSDNLSIIGNLLYEAKLVTSGIRTSMVIGGNLLTGSGGEIDTGSGVLGVMWGNMSGPGAPVELGVGGPIVGNYLLGAVTVVAGGILVGNNTLAVDLSQTGVGDPWVVVGNMMPTLAMDAGGNPGSVVVGNRMSTASGTQNQFGDGCVYSCNVVMRALTINGNDNAVVANYVGGVLTDSGTGNQVANNV